ncbi:MAG: hypothetical protein C3F17_18280 [Bradyrhizobiaceae bacterium]|nr:MAG: hypothetical protein C3F17_18280 [Bradyrhizobiaceae bacterium]
MPTVAIINGIRVEFYFDEDPPPHFHARYAEFIAQIEIERLVIVKGSLPNPQLRMVQEWASSRREQLRAAWEACASGSNPGRIP